MTDKTWKALERRICPLFLLTRTPLSGNRRAGIGMSDCIGPNNTRPDIFIEIKHRKKIPFARHIDDARKKADEEGLPMVFVIHETGRKHAWAIMDVELAAKMWLCWREMNYLALRENCGSPVPCAAAQGEGQGISTK